MNDAVERYTDGLAEGLTPELLEPEAVSRKAILRERIAEQREVAPICWTAQRRS